MSNWRDTAIEVPHEAALEATPGESGLVQMLSQVGNAEGAVDAFGRGAANGATLGFKGEGVGLMQALAERFPSIGLNPLAFAAHLTSGRPVSEFFTNYLDEQNKRNEGRGQSFLDSYRQNRDNEDARDKAAEEAHGGFYLGGNLVGGLAPSVLMPGSKAKGFWELAKQGGKIGALSGAAYGLGSSGADLTTGNGADYAQAGLDTLGGGVLGGAIGAAAPPVVGLIGGAARKVGAPLVSLVRGGYIRPTAEAQRLVDAGANLTLGRMDPSSPLGRFEELATSKADGGSLKILRNQGDDSVRDIALKAAGAPGAKPPTAGAPVLEQLDQLRAGFGQVYSDALDGVRLPDPSTNTSAAFEAAAKAPEINATGKVRAQALKWLKNEVTSLAPADGTVDARAMQALRTRLRDEIRGLGDEGDDRAMKQIIKRAEGAVSDLLGSGLPPERAAMLKSADDTYRNLLAVEEAAKSAAAHRNDHQFSPAALLNAIRNRGATPALDSVARDANKVLTATYPLTGIQGAAGEVAPVTKYLGPAWAHLSNTVPWMRNHALNPLWTPGLPARAFSAAGRALGDVAQSPRATSAAARTLYDLINPPAPPVSSLALEDEDRPAWAVAP